ncbi:MAG: insulinase family protein [Deltaproteobacteria bacterium]|nr:insulinase family protein [Deltaproteobacteria bacterium]
MSASARLLSTILVLFLSAPAARAELEDPALGTHVETLDNGLTILALREPTTPVVSFQVWVKAGSRDESRYTGIAHLFEHMMFKGSTNLGPEEHAHYVEERGGRINAFTSKDVTVYFEDVTPDALPLIIDLEAERFGNLVVTEEMLASEREVVLEERRMRTEDRPQGRAFEALLATTFLAHPYRWPVIGWRSDIEQVTVEACQEFFDAYYAPNNLVVAVAGNFELEPTLERIRASFGAMAPASSIPRNPTLEPEQKGERRSVVHFDARAPILAAAWPAPPTGHPDGPALDVASQILSGGRSSRLYRRLIYDEQVALSASSAWWELKDLGILYAFSTVRPGVSVDRVEALCFEEIARMGSEPATPAEIEKAQRRLEASLVRGLSTVHALASRLGRDWVNLGRIRPLDEILAEIQAVTAADVQRVMAEYMKPEKRTVVHVISPPPPSMPEPEATPEPPPEPAAATEGSES